jgi:hypothetical protein
MNRFLFFLLGFSLLFACSSPSGPTGACAAYTVPSGEDLTKPAVSFGIDVQPILVMSCGLSDSCHGSTTNGRVFLGSSSVNATPSSVRAGIVNVPSVDLPSMPFVKPGDPANSFLMHKMDGDQCALDAQCTGMTCQTSMPQNLPLLDVPTRDVVRRWIAQGAPDD